MGLGRVNLTTSTKERFIMKTGFTTITFRHMSIDELIQLAKETNLTGIEWGGDVHVPPDSSREFVCEVKQKCTQAGLDVLSYGSYYRGLTDQEFIPILNTASILGAPIIRIWAGNKSPDLMDDAYFIELVANIQTACDLALKKGIKIALEYHDKTMTETKEAALKLIQAVNRENLFTYWQPNPNTSFEEHIAEIDLLMPWICTYHIFAWEMHDDVRHHYLLDKHSDIWKKYLLRIALKKEVNLILEHSKDEDRDNFVADTKTLHKLVKKGGYGSQTLPKALLMSTRERDFDVYSIKTLTDIDTRFNLPRFVINGENYALYKEELAQVEVIFSTWNMVEFTTEQIKELMPNLKAVFYGAGSVQHFARPFLENNVRVFSGWGANAIPVAEFILSQIVLSSKGYFQNVYKYRKQTRDDAIHHFKQHMGMKNIKIGLLGGGMISRRVIELLQKYDVQIMLCSKAAPDSYYERYNIQQGSLEEIFSQCDIISNNLPNKDNNQNVLNYELFSRMKPYSTFINTGRAAQVNEEGLCRALEEDNTKTALLDVEEPEPNSPLLTMENIFVSTHIAGSSGNETFRLGEFMCQEAENFLLDKDCIFEVDLKRLETMA